MGEIRYRRIYLCKFDLLHLTILEVAVLFPDSLSHRIFSTIAQEPRKWGQVKCDNVRVQIKSYSHIFWYLQWPPPLPNHHHSYHRQHPQLPILPNLKEQSHLAHTLPSTTQTVLQTLPHPCVQLLKLLRITLPLDIPLQDPQSSRH